MHSRAHLMIERDINELKEKNPWVRQRYKHFQHFISKFIKGIQVDPIRDDSLFELSAEIHGEKNGAWEGKNESILEERSLKDYNMQF